jgi:signal peptidase
MRKKIKEIICTIILAALIAPAIIYAVTLVVNGYSSSVIMSGSMEPAIPVGSIVVVKSVDPDKVKIGDVIVFQRNNSKTLHRVIAKIAENNSYSFKTKGDANEYPDQWLVQPEEVRESLLLTIPYYGYLLYFAGTPIGFVFTVIVPAAFLIGNEVKKIIQLKKEEKNEQKISADSTAN